MSKTIEQRIQALEDVQAITNLMGRYLNAADGGWDRASHNADLVVSLFTEDGSWEADGVQLLAGHDALRAGFSKFREVFPFAFHTVTNPIIEVDGDTATGEWHLVALNTDAAGNEVWSGAIYTNHFVRSLPGWRFKSIFVKIAYTGPYEDGWAKSMGVKKTFL